MRNKQTIKAAFLDTLPVMAGYLVLGMGFGLLLRARGFGVLWRTRADCRRYRRWTSHLAAQYLAQYPCGNGDLYALGATGLLIQHRRSACDAFFIAKSTIN